MLSSQEEQAEHQRVFAENQSLPRQATTMHQFALADALTPRGRYTTQEQSTVTGANPVIDYPAGPAWCADPGSQLLEPPLGLDNPALEPARPDEAQATGDPNVPATPLAVERVGSPLSQSGDPSVDHHPVTNRGREVGSPVAYRRY
jgi:hypothetical protein